MPQPSRRSGEAVRPSHMCTSVRWLCGVECGGSGAMARGSSGGEPGRCERDHM